MEELLELRTYLEQERYADALLLLNEMEEMAKEDKLHKIRSFAIVLLIHLIKQHAERRSTRSWEYSIQNSTEEIRYVNRRRKAKGTYATPDELREMLEDAYRPALGKAALEAFEGTLSAEQLAEKIDRQAILDEAFRLITEN
jgi:hypothetical protein